MKIPTVIGNGKQQNNTKQNRFPHIKGNTTFIGRNVDFSPRNRENSQQKRNNDDTRQISADKYIHPESVYSHVEEGNDFILQHVKRRTKSFFVCGFKPPISEETINELCTERDVKITHAYSETISSTEP